MFHYNSRRSTFAAIGILAGALIVAAPTRGLADCVGDCDYSGSVEIGELVIGVDMFLGGRNVDRCRAFDGNTDGRVTVDELVAGVRNALLGCNALPPGPRICGDGQIDESEICDDGNTEDGDGCAADCAELEGPGVIDQAWFGSGSRCGGLSGASINIGLVEPIGQEFIPQSATLTQVAVSIWPAMSTIPPSELGLVIHADSITGPPVASQTITTGPLSARIWQRFDFSPAVELTPGARYVIELLDPAHVLMWSFTQIQKPCSPFGYDDGRGIFEGALSSKADFGFATFTAD